MRKDIDLIKQYIEAIVQQNYLLIKAIEAAHPELHGLEFKIQYSNMDDPILTIEEKEYILKP